MIFIKNNIKYLFIFLFSLICMSILLVYFDGDVLWNYGFSYAISKGEIPYLDFNMILTPAYSFIMSVGLLLNKNILIFYIENALLITALFYFLFQLFPKKAYFYLILLVFPIPALVFPSYNLFLIFLLVAIIYLEKKAGNDYLLGILIALSFLTKQTVGIFLIIPSFVYYYKKKEKLLKRIVGFVVPCFIFLAYLLFTKSLAPFIDLCFLGLLDFSNSNGFKISFSLFIGLFLLGISIYLFIKNRKKIEYLYVLLFSSIMIPLFDFPHIEYYFFTLSLLFIEKINFRPKELLINSVLFSLFFTCFFFSMTAFSSKINYPNKFTNFNYRLLLNANGEDIVRSKMISYIKKNKDKEIIMLASDAYFYKITCNLEINYFDLNNKGNHGYQGTKKMKDKLSKLPKGTIVIVDSNETNSKRPDQNIQFNRELAFFVSNTFKKINKIAGYTIYEVRTKS